MTILLAVGIFVLVGSIIVSLVNQCGLHINYNNAYAISFVFTAWVVAKLGDSKLLNSLWFIVIANASIISMCILIYFFNSKK